MEQMLRKRFLNMNVTKKNRKNKLIIHIFHISIDKSSYKLLKCISITFFMKQLTTMARLELGTFWFAAVCICFSPIWITWIGRIKAVFKDWVEYVSVYALHKHHLSIFIQLSDQCLFNHCHNAYSSAALLELNSSCVICYVANGVVY